MRQLYEMPDTRPILVPGLLVVMCRGRISTPDNLEDTLDWGRARCS